MFFVKKWYIQGFCLEILRSEKVGELALLDPLKATFCCLRNCLLILGAHFLGKVVEYLCLLALFVDEDASEQFYMREFLEDF